MDIKIFDINAQVALQPGFAIYFLSIGEYINIFQNFFQKVQERIYIFRTSLAV